jgi:DNA-binding LytR/AlgR family response regulator
MRQSFHITHDSISLERGRITVMLKDVAYLEGNINYTIIHLACGKQILSSFTLKKFEDAVPKTTFIRTHKSFIINTLFLKSYEFGVVKLTICDKLAIAVSRRNMAFMAQLPTANQRL